MNQFQSKTAVVHDKWFRINEKIKTNSAPSQRFHSNAIAAVIIHCTSIEQAKHRSKHTHTQYRTATAIILRCCSAAIEGKVEDTSAAAKEIYFVHSLKWIAIYIIYIYMRNGKFQLTFAIVLWLDGGAVDAFFFMHQYCVHPQLPHKCVRHEQCAEHSALSHQPRAPSVSPPLSI